jgi:two-component system, sensor histidine kinase LadS
VQKFYLFLVVLFIPMTGISAEILELSTDREHCEVSGQLKFLMDPRGELSVEEVSGRLREFKALPVQSRQIPRDGAMWLFLSLHNKGYNEEWILENLMNVEEMVLYLWEEGAWIYSQQTGNTVPFSERELTTRQPAFELRIRRGERLDLLIRLHDYQSSSIHMALVERNRFYETYTRRTLFLGIAFGFFAALILYNLIIFIFIRERTYLFYALYMSAFFLNQLAQERLFSQYFQPNTPYGFFWFVLFGSATAVFGIEFFRVFILTARKMPLLDKALRANMIIALALGISAFFYAEPVSADILNVVSLCAMALILTALLLRILKRDLLALVCFLGSLLYLAGTTAEILVTLLPISVTPFTLHAQLYGALAQVFFLGFAVGAKSYGVRRVYDQMQRRFKRRLRKEVQERTAELEEANLKLAKYAVTDPLTGLYNRGELERREQEFDTYFERKEGEAGHGYVISAAYLDLDNFKYCNDSFGHDYGDRILQKTAGLLRQNTRGYDILFRLGGDEFLILMPETDIHEARGILERIRLAIEEKIEKKSRISVSIGLASSRENPGSSMEELINAADAALLRSKEAGKNLLTVSR